MTEKNLNNTKLLRKALKLTAKDLQTFKEIGEKRSAVIFTQDALGKELSAKNMKLLNNFTKNEKKLTADQKLDALSDILFRNFDIQAATIEVLKCYIDEYFDRFNILHKDLSKTLHLLEKYIEQKESN